MVLVFAGSFILFGTAMGAFFNAWFLLIPAFVGANLLQAAFSGFCPLAKILKRMGVMPGNIFR